MPKKINNYVGIISLFTFSSSDNKMFVQPVSKDEIERSIETLTKNKAPELDWLTAELNQNFKKAISPVL